MCTGILNLNVQFAASGNTHRWEATSPKHATERTQSIGSPTPKKSLSGSGMNKSKLNWLTFHYFPTSRKMFWKLFRACLTKQEQKAVLDFLEVKTKSDEENTRQKSKKVRA
jgi:hypothetical protein